MKTSRILSKSISSLILLGALGATQTSHASNVWDGGGASDVWSDVLNWDNDLFPTYGTLTFAGSTRTTNIVDADISMSQLVWTGASAWALNGSNTISLFDNSGTQAKVENQSTGALTINAPITFAATSGAAWGEINAVNGDITFGSGALTVSGSAVAGIRLFGAGHTTAFNNTVSASGKYFATTAVGDTITIGGAFTSGDIYLMNSGVLNVGSAGTVTSSAVRLGGDFATTGAQDLTKGATLNLTAAGGGQTFASTINTVGSNTSNALVVNSQNTTGTNTLSGFVVLDSALTINQAAGGTLNITQAHTDGVTGATGVNVKTLGLTLNAAAGANINVSGNIYSNTNAGVVTANGNGTVNLSSGNNAANLFVRQGTVQIGNGGSFTASGYSSVGQAAGDNGTLTLTGNGAYTVGGDLNVSDVANTVGTLNMNSTGTVLSTNMFVGKTSAIGTLNVSSGNVNTQTLLVGAAGTAQGIVNQTGGAVTRVTGGGDWRIGGNSLSNTVVDAANQNAIGIYNLSAGTLTTPNAFQVGGSGQGYLNQTGGTVSSGSWTDAGRSAGSYGVIDVSGGIFNQTGTGNRLFAGENGFGHITLRGTGAMTLSGGLVVGNGGTTAGGVFNLNGGTLTSALVSAAAGNALGSTFNFNGGTFKNTGTATTFTGVGVTNVFGGGAIIDTTAGSFTIASLCSRRLVAE